MNEKVKYKWYAFPKFCGCGRIYGKTSWQKLIFYALQNNTLDNKRFYSDLEYRHCACGSTISTPIHPIVKENKT